MRGAVLDVAEIAAAMRRSVGAPWLKPQRSPDTRFSVLAGKPLPVASNVR